FGEMRLAAMDRAGIQRRVLSLAGPGVQAERGTKTARSRGREANDFLAGEIAKRPGRSSAFGHLAMQDARAAAHALQRCMRGLQIWGCMMNGHTNGQYLDHASRDPCWERAQALNAVVYLHPADPLARAPVLDGYNGLRRATWEWTFETGSHALRITF